MGLQMHVPFWWTADVEVYAIQECSPEGSLYKASGCSTLMLGRTRLCIEMKFHVFSCKGPSSSLLHPSDVVVQ